MALDSWIEQFPRLSAISDPVWQEVATQVRQLEFPAGTELFHYGDTCQNYLLVLDGAVRVQKVSEGGREIVLYRVEAGQSCVLTTACLLSHESYQAEAITECATRVVMFPGKLFKRALDGSPDFRSFVFSSYGERIAKLMLLVDAVAFGRMDSRLAQLLIDLGQPDQRLSMTHQQLSRELGTAREVVSRLLKNFEQQGWVALSRGVIQLLDRDALEKLSSARER